MTLNSLPLASQEYVLTKAPVNYSFQPFGSSPSYCGIEAYVITVGAYSSAQVQALIDFNGDHTNPMLTFYSETDWD